MKLSDTPGLLKDTVMAWSSDNATRLSAALAYYAVFSIAPILIIIIAVVALVFGREAAQGQIAGELSSWLGATAANDVQSWVAATGQSKSSIWATVIGIGVLLLGASTFFGELKNALNAIWGVTTRPGHTISTLVLDKLLGVSMILCIGLLLMASLFISALITGFSGWLATVVAVHPFVWKMVDLFVSFSITTTLFSLIFKILPNVHLTWRDVLPGALVTAGLFAAGKSLIAWYLGTSSAGSAFGAAGTVIILLLGVYYLTGILFFGAEFTKVYLLRSGGKIVPNRFGALATPAAAQGVDESKAGANAANVVKENTTAAQRE
jgi:membrane protein